MLPRDAPSLINLDDPAAPLADCLAAGRRPTRSTARPTSRRAAVVLAAGADVRRANAARLHSTSSRRSSGRPNVYNILAAVSTATALGISFDAIERGITSLEGVPGRFQVVSGMKDDVTVVRRTTRIPDDALRNLLETARPLTAARLITVFGCGGDRDRTKRPLMGAVAGRLSDLIVITSDNPRSEDPLKIIEEIQRGITVDTRRDTAQRMLTYQTAMRRLAKRSNWPGPAMSSSSPAKGHEKYQIVGGDVRPFDDVAVARDALGRKRSNSGVV
jgi:UDP-N-acetylmuramoyl-L-alanyl-D-glutamate--2,6-diaminopimelate ligase